MDIEFANRLKTLRQNAGLSQEELAAKLNISRQAVSKWERGEASPDIDNLVVLSRLYNVSVDELLTGESVQDIKEEQADVDGEAESDEEPVFDSSQDGGNENDEGRQQGARKKDYVHIDPFDGVHVHTVDGDHVDISWRDGVRVHSKDGDDVDISASGVHVNNETVRGHVFSRGREEKHFAYKFPYAILSVMVFLAIGLFFEAWHPAWLVFLTIPIYYSAVDAVVKKNANHFAYPVLVALVYLIAGFFFAAWHPMWILFLTIPLYYFFINWAKSVYGHYKENK